MSLQKIDFYVNENNQAIPNEIFLWRSLDDANDVSNAHSDHSFVPSLTMPGLTVRERPAFAPSQVSTYREPVTKPLKTAEWYSCNRRFTLLGGTASVGVASFILVGILGSTGTASQPQPALTLDANPEPQQLKETETRSPLPNQTQKQTQKQTASQAKVNPLQQAQTFADRAQLLSQSAQSVDDWKLVVRQWQRAVGVLKAVPSNSSSYPVARQQLQRFNSKLANAARKANQSIAYVPTLAQANVVGGEVFCPSSSRSMASSSGQTSNGQTQNGQTQNGQTQNEQPKVELTNVAFEEPGAGVETSITGCITNHTNQPITQVSIVYKGTSAQVAGLVETGKEEVISVVVQPGATVGFRSRYTVSPSISNLDIQAVSWTVAGHSEPQIAAATAQLVR